ncbi:hypothetical protein DND132_2004 [Pseudodesulfovibrio mercurii]|uniref:Outer-membrane lipoprotein LolB n=1 Tax=Pseudodesulfovibrio mercurii TaxID=641491 RepID=F0JH95_9BACT|nr:hypothetical protein [Pseudodesulfovibrio mercurii]EGB15210.1 hypothetical protein DND132_2004 [Pseudodesulfovibrio mercurii]
MSRLGPTLVPAATLAVLILAVLSGCATRIPPGMELDTPKAAWTAFRQHYCARPEGDGLRVRASLYYSRTKPTKRTNRTLISLWGDFGGPMRLDVSASIGTLLAHIREDRSGLLVFYPEDNRAYAHKNPVLGATRLGMPFPFSLDTLAHALAGDFSGLAPRRYAEASVEGGNYVYTFSRGQAERIVLDRLGRPVRLEGRTVRSVEDAGRWVFTLDRYEDAGPDQIALPDKLTLAMDNGERGVLHIKSREPMLAPWPAASLALELPGDVVPIRLDNGYADGQTGELPVIREDKQ